MKPQQSKTHISYSGRVKEVTEELKSGTSASSVNAVFNEAIRFYIRAYDAYKDGSDILIRSKDGQTEKLRLFL